MNHHQRYARITLRVLLWILAVDAFAKGCALLFGGRAIIRRVFPLLPESQVTPFALMTWYETGALDLGLGVMLSVAARDPLRQTAVVYGIATALYLAAIVEPVEFYALGIDRFVSVALVWMHALVRVAVASLLLLLRSRAGDH